jgi:hypothetical protein
MSLIDALTMRAFNGKLTCPPLLAALCAVLPFANEKLIRLDAPKVVVCLWSHGAVDCNSTRAVAGVHKMIRSEP